MLKTLLATLGGLCVAAATAAFAQDAAYPERPVTLVVPAAPGGGGDFTARLLADGLTKAVGKSFVVENKAGAGGNIAATHVANAKPDGYTLLLAYSGTHVANPALFSNLQWDPIKSFVPVALTIKAPQVIVVNKDVPARTLQELIDYARANPSKLNYATSGTGTVQHIGTELLALRTGTKMIHVPYRGAGAAMTDLLSGQISLLITTPPAVVSHIRSGAVRPLAIASKTRHPMLPEVMTTSEAGIEGVELDAWFGVYAPAGTPAVIVKRLAEEMEKLVTSADFKRRAEDAGTYATFMGPADFDKFTRSELVYWSDVIKTVGVKVE